MRQIDCIIIKTDRIDTEEKITVSVNDDGDQIEITTEIAGRDIFVSQEYYFSAYQMFREKLLSMGYGLKCNGSKLNAVQSGMMGFPGKVYLVKMGKPATKDDMTDMWDYADLDDFPNTEAQQAYTRKWIDSLKNQ